MKTIFIEIPTKKIELLEHILKGENGILIGGSAEMNPRESEITLLYEWDEDEEYILEVEQELKLASSPIHKYITN